jgi:glutaredoxin-related protein
MNVFVLLSKEESIVILDNVKQNCLIGIAAMGFQSKQCVILQTIGTQ